MSGLEEGNSHQELALEAYLLSTWKRERANEVRIAANRMAPGWSMFVSDAAEN
jgi:hypothetical protein